MSKAICKLFTVGITNRIHFHSSVNESSLIIPLYIDQTVFGIIISEGCQIFTYLQENFMWCNDLYFYSERKSFCCSINDFDQNGTIALCNLMISKKYPDSLHLINFLYVYV